MAPRRAFAERSPLLRGFSPTSLPSVLLLTLSLSLSLSLTLFILPSKAALLPFPKKKKTEKRVQLTMLKIRVYVSYVLYRIQHDFELSCGNYSCPFAFQKGHEFPKNPFLPSPLNSIKRKRKEKKKKQFRRPGSRENVAHAGGWLGSCVLIYLHSLIPFFFSSSPSPPPFSKSALEERRPPTLGPLFSLKKKKSQLAGCAFFCFGER